MQNTIVVPHTTPPKLNYAAYYCPLAVDVYPPVGDTPTLFGGDYAALYEEAIHAIIAKEDLARGHKLSDYYWGSPSIAGKLTSLDFSVCNLEGRLFGCFIADLTAPLTPAEDALFRDWLTMQCTEGYGERLEQYSFETDEGIAYLSFRSAEKDTLILSARELSGLFD